MAELADASDLKSEALNGAWGFDSPSRHHLNPAIFHLIHPRVSHRGIASAGLSPIMAIFMGKVVPRCLSAVKRFPLAALIATVPQSSDAITSHISIRRSHSSEKRSSLRRGNC